MLPGLLNWFKLVFGPFGQSIISMTPLSMHNFAHFTRHSFWPKINNQPFNPKRPWLFGLLNTQGGEGAGICPFWKTQSYSSQFHFRATNRVSYESWHIFLKFDTLLRLLRLNLRPLEVAEVAKVQTKKNRSKILKSAIFELQKCYTPQKKAENNCHSDLKQNQRLLYWKNWKKVDFAIFDPKNQDVLSVSAKFLENLSR